MQATQKQLCEFMSSAKTFFIIPVFQRNYDWRKEHCQQLLEDIINVGSQIDNKTHFVGSIVFIQPPGPSSPRYFTIIDGQQRLTTVTLIWLALKRKAELANDVNLVTEINELYLFNKHVADLVKIKLKQLNQDNKAIQFLMEGGQPQDFEEYSRVIENFAFFYDSIKQDDIYKLKVGLERLEYIDVSLEQGKDDPQRIFQSLNSTGKSLTQSDLIRNYVLIDLPASDQKDIYENQWKIIEENSKYEDTQESKLTDFIRDYLTFKLREIPALDKVFETFKKTYPIGNKSVLISQLEELKKYSKYFYKLFNPHKIEGESDLKIRLKRIKELEITVAYPFLLEVFDDYSSGKITYSQICEVLDLVQSFAFRRFICSFSTNGMNKIFMDLHKKVDFNDYVHSLEIALVAKKSNYRMPTNEEVRKSLETKDMYHINKRKKSYFFEVLENYGKPFPKDFDHTAKSIEHILPQNPSKAWREELAEDYDAMRSLIHTVANLTLSPLADNSTLSNKTFVEKVEMPQKGYKYSDLEITQQLLQYERWNLFTYRNRLEWIYNRCINIWKYPKVGLIDGKLQGEELNILDIHSDYCTGKKIEKAYFFDKVFEKPSYREVYLHVLSVMLEREPHIILTTDLYKSLKITTKPGELRMSGKISDVYYVDTHLSSSAIIYKLQSVLNRCETDDDLLILFEEEDMQSEELAEQVLENDITEVVEEAIEAPVLEMNESMDLLN